MIADAATIILAMSGVIAVILKRATNDGRITQILTQLQSTDLDHETRIRVLEGLLRQIN